ncbi:hypothetical protein [Hymenobacter sp. APR13]|uniref:hypothetical protein n=1 Tax=Hymenobacter sp. APR13 TaxID=1356852 RepID=UPI0004E05884|nr:hypothetical protein [Hymenobacter sp. APR13]AII53614.1 hypothetical protein N008_16740 [Hymenobacter sp. APR13]
MKTTADYIATLSFDYLTTYSLLRGPKWEQLQQAAQVEAQRARKRLLTCAAPDLPALRDYLNRLRNTNDLATSTLMEVPGAYNLTATPIASLPGFDSRIQVLLELLSLPAANIIYWMCAPVYRDAIVFYSADDEVVGMLNICLGCDTILTQEGEELAADAATYAGLHHWLTSLGHAIESPRLS